MNILRMTFQGYRSLRDVQLVLGPYTVFVGPNNVGKTNIVDAIAFYKDILFDLDWGITIVVDSSISSFAAPMGQRSESSSALKLNSALRTYDRGSAPTARTNRRRSPISSLPDSAFATPSPWAQIQ